MKTLNKLTLTSIFLSMMFVFAVVMPGEVSAQYGCSYHSYQVCQGNNLYWYDSCGNQQDLIQYCPSGCYNGVCSNNNNYNYNNYGNCTYHAYRLCSGNNIYWYNSCGVQQDLYYSCTGGQTCQYGQCVAYAQNYNVPANNYNPYYKTACYGSSIYWYDSLGVASGLYKNCKDSNSCTADACSAGKCLNTKKCDGSTCAVGSADYNAYCSTTENELSVSFFTKQSSGSTQWQKTAQFDSNSQVYFMISVVNSGTTQIDNVSVSANIPNEIFSLGNLQLNGVSVSGDIVLGVNIGSIAPTNSKLINFEGKTQTILENTTKQATAMSNVFGVSKSDSVSITLNPGQPAAVSGATTTSGFWEFLKRWYLWILGGLVLALLFIFVFRRLSSDV